MLRSHIFAAAAAAAGVKLHATASTYNSYNESSGVVKGICGYTEHTHFSIPSDVYQGIYPLLNGLIQKGA